MLIQHTIDYNVMHTDRARARAAVAIVMMGKEHGFYGS